MKRMLCVYAFLVWVLLGPASANAQQNDSKRVAAMRFHEGRLKRVAHYVTTHKELLISDTLVVLAWSADAASSVHCQRIPGCNESNPLLGKHPNEVHTWLGAMAPAAALVTLDHLAWYVAPDRFDQHLFWFGPIGTSLLEVFNVKANVDSAQFLQNLQKARARLAP